MLSQVSYNWILFPRGLNKIKRLLKGLRKVVASILEKSSKMRYRE
jgi:hypothetical protein